MNYRKDAQSGLEFNKISDITKFFEQKQFDTELFVYCFIQNIKEAGRLTKIKSRKQLKIHLHYR